MTNVLSKTAKRVLGTTEKLKKGSKVALRKSGLQTAAKMAGPIYKGISKIPATAPFAIESLRSAVKDRDSYFKGEEKSPTGTTQTVEDAPQMYPPRTDLTTLNNKAGTAQTDTYFRNLENPISLTGDESTEYQKQLRRGSQFWGSENQNVQAALNAKASEEEALNEVFRQSLESEDVQERSIIGSTIREGIGSALSKAGPAAAITAAGTGGNPYAAAAAFGVTMIGSLYNSYVSNEKESVKVVYKQMESLRTGVASIVSAVNADAMTPEQGIVYMDYADDQMKKGIAKLRQKEIDGALTADVSDYDSRMVWAIETQKLWFPAARSRVMKGAGMGEFYMPSYDDVLEAQSN